MNDNFGQGYGAGSKYVPETPVAASYSSTGLDLRPIPGGWDETRNTIDQNHPSITSTMPQYPPPGPPRADGFRHQMNDQYYPPSPPPSGSHSRATPPIREAYHVQSPTPIEANGRGNGQVGSNLKIDGLSAVLSQGAVNNGWQGTDNSNGNLPSPVDKKSKWKKGIGLA